MAATASWVGSADNWPEAPMFSYSGASARAPLIVGIAMIGNPLLLLVRLLTRFTQQHGIKLRAIGVDPGDDYDLTQL